jgi:hypothetical protein
VNIKKKEREFLIFMENIQQNEENPSLTKFYDELVRRGEEVLDANVARMSNAQLIEFYDYCVCKSDETDKEGCELYFYACILLEEKEIIKMYKNGQLDNGMTLDEEDIPYMTSVEVTEEDIVEINRICELLEQRKKDKKNPIKRLVRFFKG